MPSASFRNKQKLTFRPARREDGDVVNVELDIDTNGYVAGIPNSASPPPASLVKFYRLLHNASSAWPSSCSATIRAVMKTARDAVVIDRAFADFRSSGYPFRELMVSLLKWSISSPES
jgi:hypothetical protein